MGRQIVYHDELGSLSGSDANPFYTDLNQAIRAIGASNATLIINTTLDVTKSVTCPANVTLQFQRDGIVDIPSGKKLIINGRIIAPDIQIFTGAGVIDGLELMSVIKAVWWGTGQTAIQAAISISTGLERDVELTPNTHTISVNMLIPRRNTLLFPRGAKLSVDNAIVLTYNGGIVAGSYEIMTGLGSIAGEPRAAFIDNLWFDTTLTTTNLTPYGYIGGIPLRETTPTNTPAGAGLLFAKDDGGGNLRPYWKDPSDGGHQALIQNVLIAAQFLTNAYVHAFSNATIFTTVGDTTDAYLAGIKVQIEDNVGFTYTGIVSSTYAAGPNLTTIVIEDALLNVNLIMVRVGVLSPGEDSAVPRDLASINRLFLIEQGAAPGTAVNIGALYTKNVSGQPEFFYREESNGDEVQITSGGALNVPGESRNLDAKVASYVVLLTDVAKILTMNSGADTTFSLPSVGAGDVGMWFTFVKLGAGKVTINAADLDTIADSGTGDTIYNDEATETYATITLILVSETKWTIEGAHGTWITTD